MAAPPGSTRLPVAVVGAGPVGLAAAAHLHERGLDPLILEAGDQPGASIAQWRHVRLFSPWCLALDPAAMRLLAPTGWTPPDPDALPTGDDLLTRYLHPLAATPVIRRRLRLGHTVLGITRRDLDKVRSPGRDHLPFLVRVRARQGDEYDLEAGAVIDASGTWAHPNPLGAAGLPALGEHAATARGLVTATLPDILGADRARFAGRRVVVVGAGHSAATSLLALAELHRHVPATRIVWAVRSASPRPLVGKGSAAVDELPARGQLATDLRALVEAGRIELVPGFRIRALRSDAGGMTIVGQTPTGTREVQADQVINATGFRPDHTVANELRLALDPALECAAALAPLIDPNVHTCGTVPAHGARELAHPDRGYWIVGIKSYGRALTFLLATGYEQVRSVTATLAGDHTAATVASEPPTDRFCRTTRELIASGRRQPRPTATQPTTAPALPLPGAPVEDWAALTCCDEPTRIPPPATTAP
jgi:thioredoxin reductase